MKEELISYKTAVLAKEKGFDNSIYGSYINQNLWYLKDGTLCFCEWDEELESVDDFLFKTEDLTPRPTQSLLQKWLREEYNFYIGCINSIGLQWSCHIDYQDKDNIWCNRLFIGESYEETLELTLYEALKLI